MKKSSVIVVGISMLLILTGCSPTELEERIFPLIVMVDYEDGNVMYYAGLPRQREEGKSESNQEVQLSPVLEKGFDESKKRYEENLTKRADYNHLKVLVLGEELIENKTEYMRLLDEIAGKEEYPRNTYVCVTEEIEDLLEIQAELPQDMGSYLEEFLKNNRAQTVTLGDLLDEKANRKRNLKLPYISPQDTYVRWDGYYELKVENLEK